MNLYHLALLDQRLCDIVVNRHAEFHAVELHAWFEIERTTNSVWKFIQKRWERIAEKTEFEGTMLKIMTLEPSHKWVVYTDKDAVVLSQ